MATAGSTYGPAAAAPFPAAFGPSIPATVGVSCAALQHRHRPRVHQRAGTTHSGRLLLRGRLDAGSATSGSIGRAAAFAFTDAHSLVRGSAMTRGRTVLARGGGNGPGDTSWCGGPSGSHGGVGSPILQQYFCQSPDDHGQPLGQHQLPIGQGAGHPVRAAQVVTDHRAVHSPATSPRTLAPRPRHLDADRPVALQNLQGRCVIRVSQLGRRSDTRACAMLTPADVRACDRDRRSPTA